MTSTALRSHLWQDLTNGEIAAARDADALVLVPVGAIEQHGVHLAVNTDILLSSHVALKAAERVAALPVLVAPGLPFGFSPHHLSEAGTISLRLETYMAVIGDIVRCICDSGFRRVLLVNGHGGNNAPLRAKVTQMVTDGYPVAAIDYWVPTEAQWIPRLRGQLKRGGHACEQETALTLAVRAEDSAETRRVLAAIEGLPPRTVQPWIAPGHTADPLTAAGASWPPIFHADDCGYYGDPAAATPANGQEMLELTVAGLAHFIEAFAATPLRLGVARNAEQPGISPALIAAPR